jgi:hypothetical protein
MHLVACFTVELECVTPIPEFYWMDSRFSTITTDELFPLRTPIEPTEVMFFLTSIALEAGVPRASKDIVLECKNTISDWIL